jgi:arylsulfatase A-like enzyme
MKNRISRREVLKLLGLLPLSLLPLYLRPNQAKESDPNKPNIIILVFDAFSYYNTSLYGYPRKTTPYLEQLADRATIYHNHYSAGNFTTSGTASILTGTYPWTHRAIKINSEVHESILPYNIFNQFPDYHRITYSHNPLVNTLQNQFIGSIDNYTPREELIISQFEWFLKLFKDDEDIATISWAKSMGANGEDLSSLLFLPQIYNLLTERREKLMESDFPLGLPKSSLDNFLLEDAIDWLTEAILDLPRPFLGYFHFLPPHAPYNTRQEFTDAFRDDGLPIIQKPRHPLAKKGRVQPQHGMDYYRRTYDEFILYVDAEFNRLFTSLERNGTLENTYLILTSDHGEMFERGVLGHTTACLHAPVVRTPMIIFEPGQVERKDIFTTSSSVDILPTALHLAGKPVPSWAEGVALSANRLPDSERSVYCLEAKTSEPLRPLNSASAMIVKGKWKLNYYFGYQHLRRSDTLLELFDIDNDPEELNDLSTAFPSIVADLLEELNAKIENADQPYTAQEFSAERG